MLDVDINLLPISDEAPKIRAVNAAGYSSLLQHLDEQHLGTLANEYETPASGAGI